MKSYLINRCYLPHCISLVKGLCEQPVTLLIHFVSMECLLASKKRKYLLVVVEKQNCSKLCHDSEQPVHFCNPTVPDYTVGQFQRTPHKCNSEHVQTKPARTAVTGILCFYGRFLLAVQEQMLSGPADSSLVNPSKCFQQI